MTKGPSSPILFPIEGAAGRTGDWRTQKPVVDPELCILCNICWKFCPDNAIYRADRDKDQIIKFDYEYCKGCGICASECPSKAITMFSEDD
ncbi:MAG: 4Fe-4S binding protein [Candidatus Heimdallarchaeota archaeon]|nr:4Fe-4S binding protein [Candidatus Heimdallarchaeota archaeon]